MERPSPRQEAAARSRLAMEERVAQLREKLGLKGTPKPLPGEAAFEDTEIDDRPSPLSGTQYGDLK